MWIDGENERAWETVPCWLMGNRERAMGCGMLGMSRDKNEMKTYGKRLGADAVLNHGDADGEGAAVEVAVLFVFGQSEGPPSG